jgi:signal transduction histidine kinase
MQALTSSASGRPHVIREPGTGDSAISPALQQWLATLGHEMRTPLNAIIGLASLLIDQRKDAPDAELVRHLGIIRCCGEHLLSLGNDLLESGRIAAGELTLHPQVLDIDELLAEVHATLEPLASMKGLDFVATRAATTTAVHADRRALRQIMLNLAANAIKYTEHGTVGLEASVDARAMRMGVRDTGVGIAEADLGRLFKPFSQLATPAGRRDGVGLGLHVSTRIARSMGAHIEVCSEPGVGSVFTLVLPLGAA